MFKTFFNPRDVRDPNITYVNNYTRALDDDTHISSLENTTFVVNTTRNGSVAENVSFIVENIRLLKAIVLCVVVVILILSMGKFVLKMVSSYIDGENRDEDMVPHPYRSSTKCNRRR